jgi:hypothetical protein
MPKGSARTQPSARKGLLCTLQLSQEWRPPNLPDEFPKQEGCQYDPSWNPEAMLQSMIIDQSMVEMTTTYSLCRIILPLCQQRAQHCCDIVLVWMILLVTFCWTNFLEVEDSVVE